MAINLQQFTRHFHTLLHFRLRWTRGQHMCWRSSKHTWLTVWSDCVRTVHVPVWLFGHFWKWSYFWGFNRNRFIFYLKDVHPIKIHRGTREIFVLGRDVSFEANCTFFLCLCTTKILVQFYCHRPKMQNSPKMANPSQASPKATPQASCSLPQRSSRCSWQVGAISVVTDDNSNLALCHFFFPITVSPVNNCAQWPYF